MTRHPPQTSLRRSQEIRYCRSPDGVRIAYAVSGKARRFFARRTGCRICNMNGKAQCGDTGSIRFQQRTR